MTRETQGEYPIYEFYISYADIQDKIDKLGFKHILVVIDACYACTFDLAEAGRPAEGERSGSPYSSVSTEVFTKEKLRSSEDWVVTIEHIRYYLDKGSSIPYSNKFGSDAPGSNFLFIRR